MKIEKEVGNMPFSPQLSGDVVPHHDFFAAPRENARGVWRALITRRRYSTVPGPPRVVRLANELAGTVVSLGNNAVSLP